MKSKPQTYHLKHIWESYALSLLAANPEWWGKYHNKVQNYYLYRKYEENGKPIVIDVFDYGKFREIIETYFQLAQDAIIDGKALDMTNGIGKVAARRVERNHTHRTINYAKTRLQPKVWSEELGKEIRKKIIYHTMDDWCRIGWHKYGRLKNETVYEFVITRNNKEYCNVLSFNQKLDKALKAKPLLKYKYIFYPLKDHKQYDT